jgi:hypothetical protein
MISHSLQRLALAIEQPPRGNDAPVKDTHTEDMPPAIGYPDEDG